MSDRGQPIEPLIKRTRLWRIIMGVAIALTVLFALGAAGLIWAFRTGRAVEYVRERLIQQLDARCEVQASFEDLRILPFKLQLQLSDLSLTQGDSPFMSVEEALVSVRLLPLFYGRFQLHRAALLEPRASITFKDGAIENLPPCLAPRNNRPEPTSTLPVALGVSELTVEKGAFTVRTDDVTVRLQDIGVAVFPGETGGTDLALGLDGAVVEARGESLYVDRFRLVGHFEGLLTQPRALVVDQLDVVSDEVRIQATGALDLLGPVADLALKVDVDLERLRRWVPETPRTQGKVAVEAQLAGPLFDPRVNGKLQVENLQIGQYGPFDRVQGRFQADRSGVEASGVEVRLGDGGAVASAELKFEEGLPLRARAEAQRLSLGHLLHALNVPHPWADLRATGPAAVSGTLKPVSLEGPFDFRTDSFFVSDRSFWEGRKQAPEARMLQPTVDTRVHGRWHYTATDLNFIEAKLEAPVTRATVNAKVGLQKTRSHIIDVAFDPVDFVEVGPIAGVPFTGVGTLEGRVRIDPMAGTGPVADAVVDLEGASAADLPLGQLAGPVRWRNVVDLSFPSVRGRLGRTPYTGSIDLELKAGLQTELHVEVPDGRLQDLRRLLSAPLGVFGRPEGDVSGSCDLSGPFVTMDGDVVLRTDGFEIFGERFESGEVDVKVESGDLNVTRADLSKGGVLWNGSGRYGTKSGEVDARLRFAQFPLQALTRPPVDGLAGLADFEVQVKGPVETWQGSYRLSLAGAGIGQSVLGSGTLEGPVDGRTLGVVGKVGGVRLDGKFAMEGTYPFEGTVQLSEAPLLSLAAEVQKTQTFGGRVTGEAELQGEFGRWSRTSGTAVLERLNLQAAGGTWTSVGTTRFRVEDGGLTTEEGQLLVLEGVGSRIQASGSAGPVRLDARVAGALDLALLERLSSSAERAGGRVGFEAALTGTPARFDLVGTADVRDGLVVWSRIDDPFTDIQGRLSFSQRAILLDRVRARWAGGDLNASGRVAVEDFGLGRVALIVDLDGPRPRFILPSADAVGTLSGRLSVGGRADALTVAGELDVARGLIEPRIDVRALIAPAAPVSYDPSAEIVTFDIGLNSDQPVRVQSPAISAEVEGEVRFTGTNQRPGMLGSASVRPGGRVSLLGRNYTLLSGVMEFQDRYRFDPSYELSAETTACSAQIRVGVSGTLEEFDTVYSSNPEMGRTDILSCLIRGIRAQQLANESNLGAFAGSTLLKLSGVDQEVKKVIPVDQIDVTTGFSKQTRTYEPRLVVAKELTFLNRSARLEYSSSFLSAIDQQAALQLRLTPRLELQLSWTSSLGIPVGDLGLDLRRRWEWR